MNVHANPNPLKTIRRPVAIFQRAGTSSAGLNPSKALTENSEKKGEDTEGADKDKDFSMTKKDGNEAAKDVGLKSQKQTIKIKSICGKTRVFVVNLDIKWFNSSMEALWILDPYTAKAFRFFFNSYYDS